MDTEEETTVVRTLLEEEEMEISEEEEEEEEMVKMDWLISDFSQRMNTTREKQLEFVSNANQPNMESNFVKMLQTQLL